ncbi:MAG: SurA N-terminal domain-containing protein [Thermodesulfobacteriota bacterium]
MPIIKKRNSLISIIAGSIIFCLLAPSQSPAKMLDKVVAVVNGEAITSTELDRAAESATSQIRQATAADKLDETLAKARKKILAELIEELLIKQRAEELNFKVTEGEINSAVDNVSNNNGISTAELYAELAKSGISREEYRKTMTSKILGSKLVNYEVRSKIVISDEKVRDYYDNEYLQQEQPAGYHILQMGFTWGDANSSAAGRDEARQRAENIRKLVVDGQNFSELAKSFSELPSAEDGGDLGVFQLSEMAEYMKSAVSGLKPGETSEVVLTPNSSQFYQLLSKNTGDKSSFSPYELVKEELHKLLYQKELMERYDKWLREIREKAIIKTLL